MPLIDFKEIPKANTGDGNQDTFELFARDFLSEIGCEIIEEPARGADGGKDLIVLEKRKGLFQETVFRWLVSCKHFAHNQKGKTGKSVTPDDEQNIIDRVKSKNCDGFFGFYSTLPSEGLMNNLRGISASIGFQVFDSEKIESLIVGFHNRENLFLRYFPNSYRTWKELFYYTEPVKLFEFFIENSIKNFKFKDYLKSILEMVFNSLENTIKPLKQSATLEEFFLTQDKVLIVDEIACEVFYMGASGKTIAQTIVEAFRDLEITKVEEEKEISQALSNDRKAFVFPPDFPKFGMVVLNAERSYGGYFVFSNKVIMAQEIYTELEGMFYELKNILS